MSRIGIFGTSGFAREAGDIACALGIEPFYVAKDPGEREAFVFPAEVVLESNLELYQEADFIIGIGDNSLRQRVAGKFFRRLNFVNLLHPSASFGSGQRSLIDKSRGVIVCAGVRFTNNIKVGNFGIFNLNSTIGHDAIIDDFVNVAPGAHISGNVHIGERCWLGTGAVINQGDDQEKLCIGADTVIGSGSVVIKSCISDAIYVGTPAKRIK